MHAVLRRLSSALAAVVIIAAVALPALADDVSGSYRIVTATGKHMIVTLIQHEDTIEGYYAGNNGVAGRLTAKIGSDYSHITYTWVERQGDSANTRTVSGWGNMTFNDAMTVMKTAWGHDGQQQAVGYWTATLINP
jgi:hypothetical protein